MVFAEQLSGVALLWSVVSDTFLFYSKSHKYFLLDVGGTRGCVLAK